jgi:hypothetical protein
MNKHKITHKDQMIVSEILTRLMFARNMEDVITIWNGLYEEYDLRTDPFTTCPCSIKEYAKLIVEYENQIMDEKYGDI